jgi:CDP-diacylglycerol---serine O-phosphatidyltransferase
MVIKPPKRLRRELPLVQLLPNFLTLGALCASLTAIRFGIQGEGQIAVGLIMLAAVLDLLDGWVARLLHSESAIGAELDSLADFASFGVAPGLILYFWALHDSHGNGLPGLGWMAVLIYVICCALRLARFNVGNNRPASDGLEKRFFRGVPSPAGALLAFMPMYFSFMLPEAPLLPLWALALYLIAVGGLMISRIPTLSFKSVTIRPENSLYLLVGFVVLAGAMLTSPWATLFTLGLCYCASIFVAGRHLRKVPRKSEEQNGNSSG